MDHIAIREAGLNDAEVITQLVNRSYRPSPGAEGWTHEAALVEGDRLSVSSMNVALQNSVVLVGVNESSVVGCVQIEMHDQTAHIGLLAVDPSLQTSGIGKLLLEHAEVFAARDLEAEEAILIVIAARKELIDFYLRRGYRKTDEGLKYPVNAGVGVPTVNAMNLLVLKKPLNK